MRSSIASFFSYLFMASAFVFLISAICLLVIVLRYYGTSVSPTEIEVAYYLLILLIIAIILGPISLYISNKLGHFTGRKEEV